MLRINDIKKSGCLITSVFSSSSIIFQRGDVLGMVLFIGWQATCGIRPGDGGRIIQICKICTNVILLSQVIRTIGDIGVLM